MSAGNENAILSKNLMNKKLGPFDYMNLLVNEMKGVERFY
jgi:hypothetical protein